MSSRAADPGTLDRRIRAQRPPKSPVDPWRPIASQVETERGGDGKPSPWLVVFLAGSECPFTCVFCDLWRHTLDTPTPPGAIPHQLERAMHEHAPLPEGAGIKLYNASNFFDERAVPEADWPAILAAVAGFATVTVECHPRLIGPTCERFAGGLAGELEVAMGLETVHPAALAALNKRMTLGDFDLAAERLLGFGAALRVFVLVGAPRLPTAQVPEWTARTVAHALASGARVVTLIPLRLGNGALDQLAVAGEVSRVDLELVEDAFDAALALGEGVVLLDLWDLDRLASCPTCAEPRLARLERMNGCGRIEPRVDCDSCGGPRT